MNEYNFKQFLSNHKISIVNERPWYMYSAPEYNFFIDPTNCNYIDNHRLTLIQQKLYTIEIPESSLNNIYELEKIVFNDPTKSAYQLFNTIVNQKYEEERLRKKFPALQKSYENYSLMLNLCKGEENNGK